MLVYGFGRTEHFEVCHFGCAMLVVGEVHGCCGDELVFDFLNFIRRNGFVAESVEFFPYGLFGGANVDTFGWHACYDELSCVDATRDVSVERGEKALAFDKIAIETA